jgi:hypothetical protein
MDLEIDRRKHRSYGAGPSRGRTVRGVEIMQDKPAGEVEIILR